MNISQIYFLILGVATGIMSGLFGIGGGLIMVPILIFYFQFSQTAASGTSLVAMLLPVGALGAWQYYKSGLIESQHIKIGLIIGCGIFLGTLFGAKLAYILPTKWLSRLFSIVLFIGAVRLWLYSFKK